MFPRKLKIDAFLPELDRSIEELGDRAFALNANSDHLPADANKLVLLEETTQLYSGPAEEIETELTNGFRKAAIPILNSWHMSRWQAQIRIAKRIDDTEIAKLINDLDLQTYFLEVYGIGNIKPIENAIEKVWAHVSRLFIKHSKNILYVTAATASIIKICLNVEIPTALENNRHTAINGTPWDAFKNIQTRTRQERFIALSSIRLAGRDAKREAERNSTDAQKAIIIHHIEQMGYRLLRRNKFRRAKKKIPAIYKTSAQTYIFRMHSAILRHAIIHREPIRSALEFKDKDDFHPFSAANNGTVLAL